MNKTTTTIVVLAVLIALAVFFYVGRGGEAPVESVPEDVGQTSEAAANPFSEAEVENPFAESANPYQNVKTNPFE